MVLVGVISTCGVEEVRLTMVRTGSTGGFALDVLRENIPITKIIITRAVPNAPPRMVHIQLGRKDFIEIRGISRMIEWIDRYPT
ncbi:MAG: hypothetical protein AMJ88_00810 [Anaerolineae bacterium SM23_ 63]|nr:MAG: hypothetical protein AMJ88_00810 [Anaerolineae bacterium SM23_ 63]